MSDLPPIDAETPADFDAVEALIDRAFGPGRYAKSAERLREGNHQLMGVSVVAREAGAVVGCARMWPVKVGATPAVLLGPFAVADLLRNKGLGIALVEAACQAAEKAGHALVILVGDAPFFARAGFAPVDPGAVTFPGPVDMRRVLVRQLKPGAAKGLQGAVSR
ncbi:MAG: N-acetyltransferase [Alphaproteobacteria bacterium]